MTNDELSAAIHDAGARLGVTLPHTVGFVILAVEGTDDRAPEAVRASLPVAYSNLSKEQAQALIASFARSTPIVRRPS